MIGITLDAIFLGAGAAWNWIGIGNVFFGKDSARVELLHPSNREDVILSNIIGMNKTATVPVPNGGLGVLIANDATGNATGRPFGNWVQYNVFAGNGQALPAVNRTV